MVKIIVDTKSKKKSEIMIKGCTVQVIESLAEAMYKILKELNMDEDDIKERFDIFHGALLNELIMDEGLRALL